MRKATREKIVILDFGSQYSQLIARGVRELKVYCEILPYDRFELDRGIKGLIFSGGPASVHDSDAPRVDKAILESGLPILGICYGLQLAGLLLGGMVAKSKKREYGPAEITLKSSSGLLAGLPKRSRVWMSHGDHLTRLPPGFRSIARSGNIDYAAVESDDGLFYGLQFHPEVKHTEYGKKILENFVHNICGCRPTWTPASFVRRTVSDLKEQIGNQKVILALSGGVDSSVCALLLHRAVGKKLVAIFIDNGLLRSGEKEEVIEAFRGKTGLNLRVVDASKDFLERLKGVAEPEEKRRIIGHAFIEVFEREAKKLGRVKFLAQGTLYPDLIESTSFKGPSAVIKSHHNVGGLPESFSLRLVEPLKELFKDEVRLVGKRLGLPQAILGRHPFPGPGLAVRVLGEVTEQKLRLLREVDSIFIQELKRNRVYDRVWQAFAVLLPAKSVGVMGDERTYENVVALRAVTSSDGMTADWARLPHELLSGISSRIINEVQGVNRVVFDISSKPPATIEWE
jgi:GMP synthase (glutamine-hydrolysing)